MKDFINEFIYSYNDSFFSLKILNLIFGLAGFILGNLTNNISKYLYKRFNYNIHIDVIIQILLCSIFISFIRLGIMWRHQIYLPGIFFIIFYFNSQNCNYISSNNI